MHKGDHMIAKSETSEAPEPTKRVRGNARERLRKAIDRQVRDNSEEIARALVDQTLQGSLPSARLLVSLLGRKKPRSKPLQSKSTRSAPLARAAEPPPKSKAPDSIVKSSQTVNT
jgi:hypothetical protein